jgi:hypothetical protein
MAFYKYQSFINLTQSVAFDQLTSPGHATPYSGIYQCMGCGENEVSTYGHPMPPQNHHQHTPQQGAIQWRLIVSTK